jgi:hypothetical protein
MPWYTGKPKKYSGDIPQTPIRENGNGGK